jgi:hypothetical protein
MMGECPVNMNIEAPRIGAFPVDTKTQNDDFLENGSTILIRFLQFTYTMSL